MIKKISTKNYDYLFDYNKSMEMRYNPSIKEIVLTFIVVLILFGALGVFSAILASIEVNVQSIMFLSLSIITIICDIVGTIQVLKRIKSFKIIVDNQGIRGLESKKEYFLSWADVLSYGIVNENRIVGVRSGPNQSCIYFGKDNYTERFLRRKFDRLDGKFFKYHKKYKMIVIGVENHVMQESIILNIKRVITHYCTCIETSYIKEEI